MRLIDADALIEDIRKHSASYFADDFAHEWVDQQPTIEPERKKGKWTGDNACPFCGFQPWYERDIHTLSFCPNCGADLQGDDHDL